MFCLSKCWLAAGLAGALVAWLPQLRGEDFRIESVVWKEKKELSRNTTLFRGGIVYDYLASPARTAIFDKPHSRFILLDPSAKVKTEISTGDVQLMATRVQEMSSKRGNAFLKFAANPKFETGSDEKTKELIFASAFMTYRVKAAKATSSTAAEQYRDFSDWYARLNTMLNPGATPPFARMAINKELASRHLVPEAVALKIPAQLSLSGRGTSLHSEHHVSWRLLEKDLQQISDTAADLASFKTVSLDQYRQGDAEKP